jgi:hypothetical protein
MLRAEESGALRLRIHQRVYNQTQGTGQDMTRPIANENDQAIETWEITFPGSASVWVYDKREDTYRKQVVSRHSGSKMLHITRDDRKYNQELTPIENKHLDVFTNGQMRLLGSSADRDENLDIRNHLSDDQLVEMFEIRDPDLFRDLLDSQTSEVILRRMASIADQHATVTQSEILREVISERYPIGGTQRTVREMLEAGDRIGAQRI